MSLLKGIIRRTFEGERLVAAGGSSEYVTSAMPGLETVSKDGGLYLAAPAEVTIEDQSAPAKAAEENVNLIDETGEGEIVADETAEAAR